MSSFNDRCLAQIKGELHGASGKFLNIERVCSNSKSLVLFQFNFILSGSKGKLWWIRIHVHYKSFYLLKKNLTFLKYRSLSMKEVWCSQSMEGVWLEVGGATRVELLVTASFRIFSASFQCAVSTNLETARSRSEFIEWVVA